LFLFVSSVANNNNNNNNNHLTLFALVVVNLLR
jgi:hypothetical protein